MTSAITNKILSNTKDTNNNHPANQCEIPCEIDNPVQNSNTTSNSSIPTDAIDEKINHDQACQVNFPIINPTLPRKKKPFKRYNTSGDLYAARHSTGAVILNPHGHGPYAKHHIHYGSANGGTPPTLNGLTHSHRPASLNLPTRAPTRTSASNSNDSNHDSNTPSVISLDAVPTCTDMDGSKTVALSQCVPQSPVGSGRSLFSNHHDRGVQMTGFHANPNARWASNGVVGLHTTGNYSYDPIWRSHPNSLNTHRSSSQTVTCHCNCNQPMFNRDARSSWRKQLPSSPEEGLSWRRLHMSRAKLKATATTSELLSGFAMIAMVELQINEPNHVPEWLFVLFSVCTTVLVAVHIFALMISTYLLPNIDAISKLDITSLVNESPHERMRNYIEIAWAFSTVFGLFLFLVEIAILCWVKFWDYSFVAAMAATAIVIPVLVIFVAFAVHFYHSLVIHKCETTTVDLKQLEEMKKKLDNINPV